MAIDTENKRRSAAGCFLFNLNPVADGSIDVYDREHASGFYSGIQSWLGRIKVFMFRDSGTPKTGLSPVIDVFVKAIDGTNAGSAPTVSELSGGYYKFYYSIAQDTVARVDSGDALMSAGDRYLDIGLLTVDDPSTSGIADAVWDEATSGHTTSGSFGNTVSSIKKIVGFIRAMVL